MCIRSWSPWLALVLAAGCVAPKPTPDVLAPSEQQSQLRVAQTRTFELADRLAALRGVMAVLQDLGFIIERANEPLGLITAARFAEPNYLDVVGITVTVRATPDGKTLVRANAVYNNRPIEDPEVYQRFFAALQRSLFQAGG
jgi:hypothetical protein